MFFIHNWNKWKSNSVFMKASLIRNICKNNKSHPCLYCQRNDIRVFFWDSLRRSGLKSYFYTKIIEKISHFCRTCHFGTYKYIFLEIICFSDSWIYRISINLKIAHQSVLSQKLQIITSLSRLRWFFILNFLKH